MSKLQTGNSRFETRNAKSAKSMRAALWGEFLVSSFHFPRHAGSWISALAGSAIGLLAARPILAQGCALCYNTAAAASSRGITALRHGVLILMLPPVVIFGVVTLFTVRGRNRFNDEAESFGEQDRAA
jgi:hypothetical protein